MSISSPLYPQYRPLRMCQISPERRPRHRSSQPYACRTNIQQSGTQPQENIRQFMRANWLSNRIFESYDDIIDQCCFAWNQLIAQPWKIMSISLRDWARTS